MKLAESTSNKTRESGQSLLELIIAIGIFAVIVSGLSFFVLDSYVSGRLSYEMTKANFLAEEGMEVAISIRDNKWEDLTIGDHGLAISGSYWVFQGVEEDLSSQLNIGKRKIKIENIDADRKKITSVVDWQFSQGRQEEVSLITYLTNWKKTLHCSGDCTPCQNFTNRTACRAQRGCAWDNRLRICNGTCTSCDTFLNQTSCQAQKGCVWGY